MKDNYPMWICSDCGKEFGHYPVGHISTWHNGTCGWCEKENVPVTQPRDFGYPEYEKNKFLMF